MAGTNLKEAPRFWRDALSDVLAAKDADLVASAVAVLRVQPEKTRDELRGAMLDAARNAALPTETRVALLAAVRGGLPSVDPELFNLLREQLQPQVAPTSRAASAAVLGGAKLSSEQQHALIASIKTAGPFEISKLLGAFANSSDDALGLELVRALKEAPGLASLGIGGLKPRFAKFLPRCKTRSMRCSPRWGWILPNNAPTSMSSRSL
jgi:hypothetical protein